MRAPNQEAKRTGFCQAPFNDYLKMAQRPLNVIPAKAGIQIFQGLLDPGVRRGDGVSKF
jgi:hypothetical protein